MTTDPEVEDARRKIGEIAREILNGQLSYIEGARALWRLGPQARLPARDPDLTIFVGIDSETDAFPIGEVRDLWDRDALKRLQPDLDLAEKWASEYGERACRSLVDRFG